jgi:predicted transcriptional regulator
MVDKHRYGNRVITVEQRDEIIRLRETGLTQGQIARQLGVAKGVVSNATKGRVSNPSIPTPPVKVRLQSDEETLEFPSIKKAAKSLGVAHCSITNARRFGIKVKGFTVEYI